MINSKQNACGCYIFNKLGTCPTFFEIKLVRRFFRNGYQFQRHLSSVTKPDMKEGTQVLRAEIFNFWDPRPKLYPPDQHNKVRKPFTPNLLVLDCGNLYESASEI